MSLRTAAQDTPSRATWRTLGRAGISPLTMIQTYVVLALVVAFSTPLHAQADNGWVGKRGVPRPSDTRNSPQPPSTSDRCGSRTRSSSTVFCGVETDKLPTVVRGRTVEQRTRL